MIKLIDDKLYDFDEISDLTKYNKVVLINKTLGYKYGYKIIDILINNPNIKTICLSACIDTGSGYNYWNGMYRDDPNYPSYHKLINNRLHELRLIHNDLSAKETLEILDTMKHNKSITILELQCEIRLSKLDKAIHDMIRNNTTLTNLYLNGYIVDDQIYEALKHNNSIVSLKATYLYRRTEKKIKKKLKHNRKRRLTLEVLIHLHIKDKIIPKPLIRKVLNYIKLMK
jgi:hypothetical protein